MIAKVRIAPIERWCAVKEQFNLASPEEIDRACGNEVEIDTKSMRIGKCGGREWSLTEASRQKIADIYNVRATTLGYQVCEHVLEMD
jgi:hypothetical protein